MRIAIGTIMLLVPLLSPAAERSDTAQSSGMPAGMHIHQLVLLHRGAAGKPENFSYGWEFEQGHRPYIDSLVTSGAIVCEGPIEDAEILCGIFVFRANSLQETEAFAASDPAVQAGRLTYEIHPWAVTHGMMP